MLNKNVLDGLNRQINQELTAGYGYLSLSIFFEQQVLKGFAAYFRKQMAEEQTHAMKLLVYVQDRGGEVVLEPLAPPKTMIGSVQDAVKYALESERRNTASINALYQTAGREGDLATQNMLQWFINEQVEEEKWAEEFVTLIGRMGTHPGGLYMLDHHVGKKAGKE